ncbi:hypothetical protein V7128_25995 [Neobacillus vireti]|uniref:hypothetical protein n=1 Tax=Neobacillus vireti TaxID=220686 RepID=UPI002FFD9290
MKEKSKKRLVTGLETIIIMIIVGFFSMIVKKGKNSQGQSIRKPSGKTFRDIQTAFKGITDNSAENIKPLKKESELKPIESSFSTFEKEFQQVRLESEAGRIGMAAVRNQNANGQSKNTREEIKTQALVNSEPQTVLNGLIWSEILGEPRSRNPYNVKKRPS